MSTPDPELAALRQQLADALLDAAAIAEGGERPDLDEEDEAQLAALTGALVRVFADELERIASALPHGPSRLGLIEQAATYRQAVAS